MATGPLHCTVHVFFLIIFLCTFFFFLTVADGPDVATSEFFRRGGHVYITFYLMIMLDLAFAKSLLTN